MGITYEETIVQILIQKTKQEIIENYKKDLAYRKNDLAFYPAELAETRRLFRAGLRGLRDNSFYSRVPQCGKQQITAWRCA